MVSSSSPKLEDFLGGASMGSHQYGSHEREAAMALSLDSVYYSSQNAEPETTREEHPLDLVNQQTYRQQQQQIQYYSGIPCHGMYQTPLEEESKETPNISDCTDPRISQMPEAALKNWVTRQYSAHHSLEQQMDGNVVDDNGASGSVGAMNCGDLQSLSLSMSPGSQSSCVSAPTQISPAGTECVAVETKKRGPGMVGQKQPVHRKSIDTFGQRTSQYRGVTRFVAPINPLPILALCFYFNFCFEIIIFLFVNLIPPPDIDGPVDMKPISGTIVARKKDKPGKEGKVGQENKTYSCYMFGSVFFFLILFLTAILSPSFC